MSTSARPYHHGELAPALLAAARALLDEGGIGAVSLRETARRVGVSPTATYRHFRDKEALLASLAAQGFAELGAAIGAAAQGAADPLSAMGVAYVRFALEKRGLFRLMFGPEMARREAWPALDDAANRAFGWLRSGAEGLQGLPPREAAISAWATVHGLAHLLLDGLLPEHEAEALARAVTARRK